MHKQSLNEQIMRLAQLSSRLKLKIRLGVTLSDQEIENLVKGYQELLEKAKELTLDLNSKPSLLTALGLVTATLALNQNSEFPSTIHRDSLRIARKDPLQGFRSPTLEERTDEKPGLP